MRAQEIGVATRVMVIVVVNSEVGRHQSRTLVAPRNVTESPWRGGCREKTGADVPGPVMTWTGTDVLRGGLG